MGIFDWFGKKEQQNDDLEERLQQRLVSIGNDEYIDKELVKSLLSKDQNIRDKALIQSRQLAKSGNPRGQIALEEAIRIKSNNFNCEFYQPRVGWFSGDEVSDGDKKIYKLAKENKLMENPKQTQSYYAKVCLLNKSLEVMNKVKKYGDNQLQDFQLLGTHFYCKCEEGDRLRR